MCQSSYASVERSITSLESQKHFSRTLESLVACTVLSHGSIMLPPRQPRVFARLGSLAKILQHNAVVSKKWDKCMEILPATRPRMYKVDESGLGTHSQCILV